MNQNFAPSLAFVLQSEGGFSDDPLDKGGSTNHGVTQAVYDRWRQDRRLEEQSVALIAPSEVSAIYRTNYWNAVEGDQLPSGVDYCTFDFGVNSGVNRASRFLQRAAGVTEDGVIGPQTLKAVSSAVHDVLIDKLCDLRLAYLQGLSTWDHFGKGWANRVASVQVRARSMA